MVLVIALFTPISLGISTGPYFFRFFFYKLMQRPSHQLILYKSISNSIYSLFYLFTSIFSFKCSIFPLSQTNHIFFLKMINGKLVLIIFFILSSYRVYRLCQKLSALNVMFRIWIMLIHGYETI